jgi:acetolactate synthase regulatory subunit
LSNLARDEFRVGNQRCTVIEIMKNFNGLTVLFNESRKVRDVLSIEIQQSRDGQKIKCG